MGEQKNTRNERTEKKEMQIYFMDNEQCAVHRAHENDFHSFLAFLSSQILLVCAVVVDKM